MDKEKVIKGMEMCISPNKCSTDDCPYYNRPNNESGLCWDRLMTDALAMLKEQDAEIELKDKLICELQKTIKSGTMMIGKKAEVVTYDENISIVRCKDCKHGEPSVDIDGDPCIHCRNRLTGIGKMLNIQPEWFCAYGERR